MKTNLLCRAQCSAVLAILLFAFAPAIAQEADDQDTNEKPTITAPTPGSDMAIPESKRLENKDLAQERVLVPDTSELLEQCVKKLEGTGNHLQQLKGRLSDWKRDSCAPKSQFEGLSKWRDIVKKQLDRLISQGLRECRLRLGDKGCQELSYELTNDGLEVSGKVLDKDCASKVFRSAIAGYEDLELDLSDLNKLARCDVCENEDASYCVLANAYSQKVSCVGRDVADQNYQKLPPAEECSDMGEVVAGWNSFARLKKFWVLDKTESVVLCFNSYDKWSLRGSNLTGTCGLLLLRKEK